MTLDPMKPIDADEKLRRAVAIVTSALDEAPGTRDSAAYEEFELALSLVRSALSRWKAPKHGTQDDQVMTAAFNTAHGALVRISLDRVPMDLEQRLLLFREDMIDRDMPPMLRQRALTDVAAEVQKKPDGRSSAVLASAFDQCMEGLHYHHHAGAETDVVITEFVRLMPTRLSFAAKGRMLRTITDASQRRGMRLSTVWPMMDMLHKVVRAETVGELPPALLDPQTELAINALARGARTQIAMTRNIEGKECDAFIARLDTEVEQGYAADKSGFALKAAVISQILDEPTHDLWGMSFRNSAAALVIQSHDVSRTTRRAMFRLRRPRLDAVTPFAPKDMPDAIRLGMLRIVAEAVEEAQLMERDISPAAKTYFKNHRRPAYTR